MARIVKCVCGAPVLLIGSDKKLESCFKCRDFGIKK